MFEQSGHIPLHLLKLVQLQRRVDNRENVPGPGLLINEHALSVAQELFLYFQQPLPLQHDRQNVTRRDVAWIIQLNQLAQQCFGRLPLNRVRCWRGRLVYSLPVGKKPFSLARAFAVVLLPAAFADVRAPEVLLLIEQQRVIMLLVGK